MDVTLQIGLNCILVDPAISSPFISEIRSATSQTFFFLSLIKALFINLVWKALIKSDFLDWHISQLYYPEPIG